MSPALSIVIPSHRRADLLELCLKSVASCQPVDAEVLVIDDGSKDGVVSDMASRFAGVRVVRLPKSKGFAVAANAGIARATGRIVELLNDDAEVTPGWAEPALARFVDPSVVAVAPLVLVHPATSGTSYPVIDSAGDEYDDGGFARKRGHGQRLSEQYLKPGPADSVSAAAGFYRREALIRVGGFAREFGAYFEDVDLALRLYRVGGRIEYEPRSIVWHRVSASYELSPSRRVLERQSCNEERLFWRHSMSDGRWVNLPRHVAVTAGKIARRLSEGQLTPWVSGRIKALFFA